MILIMEVLTSVVPRMGPQQLTAVTMVTTWLEMRLVSAYTMGNGVDMHQFANVSFVCDGTNLFYMVEVKCIKVST